MGGELDFSKGPIPANFSSKPGRGKVVDNVDRCIINPLVTAHDKRLAGYKGLSSNLLHCLNYLNFSNAHIGGGKKRPYT